MYASIMEPAGTITIYMKSRQSQQKQLLRSGKMVKKWPESLQNAADSGHLSVSVMWEIAVLFTTPPPPFSQQACHLANNFLQNCMESKYLSISTYSSGWWACSGLPGPNIRTGTFPSVASTEASV